MKWIAGYRLGCFRVFISMVLMLTLALLSWGITFLPPSTSTISTSTTTTTYHRNRPSVARSYWSCSDYMDENYDYREHYGAKFDPSMITHVYVLHGKPFGRTNNQLLTMLRAVDRMIDEMGMERQDERRVGVGHGNVNRNETAAVVGAQNHRGVLALKGWAFDNLRYMLHDAGDEGEGGGEEDADANAAAIQQFALRLESLNPTWIVHESRLEALGLKRPNVTSVLLAANDTYYYGSKLDKSRPRAPPQDVLRRRCLLWGQLLRGGIARRNLELRDAVLDAIERSKRDVGGGNFTALAGGGYVTVHSRWLEGSCVRRLGGGLPPDECYMTPSYVKRVMNGTIDRHIVYISDGQNPDTLRRLREDPEVGPALIVAGDVADAAMGRSTANGRVNRTTTARVLDFPQPWSDISVAIMGDAFVGTRVSTFAVMVGLSRVVLGMDPGSNFLYTSSYSPGDLDGFDGRGVGGDGGDDAATGDDDERRNHQGIAVCKSCLFGCDHLPHLCGPTGNNAGLLPVNRTPSN